MPLTLVAAYHQYARRPGAQPTTLLAYDVINRPESAIAVPDRRRPGQRARVMTPSISLSFWFDTEVVAFAEMGMQPIHELEERLNQEAAP